MRKKFGHITLAIALLIGVLVFVGCVPEVTPGASPGSLIPSQDNTFNLGHKLREWNDVYIGGYIITNSGSANLTLPTANVTLLSSGDASRDNVAMGTIELGTGEAYDTVTHGLASTPTLILMSFNDDPGNNNSILFWSNAGSTTFRVNVTANVSSAANVTWQAYITGE